MSTPTSDAIVLMDQDGRYYVIPKESLEEALVPDEAKASVDSDISDVEGFSMQSLNFSFVGNVSLSPSRVKAGYGFRASPWPCDVAAGGWPCDTPQIGGQQH